jgi:predicted O-methyltransferase YrrM
MKLDEVVHALTGIPYIDDDKKRELYEFVVREKPRRILELGFAHGTSACVTAAAAQAAGYDATIDVVDLESARAWQDQRVSIEELSARLGVATPLHVHREARCYTWWLEKKLEAWALYPDDNSYDFIFIDGAHNWTIDACAFFLCEKLLTPGGWILFDDLTYRYRTMIDLDGRTETGGVSHHRMSEDEIDCPSVGRIFELLVKTHEHFDAVRVSQLGDWGWAHKATASADRGAARELKVEVQYSIVSDLQRLKGVLQRKLKR